ncbi:hypothetical protein ACQY0O_000783 [Thecaphora frezii]
MLGGSWRLRLGAEAVLLLPLLLHASSTQQPLSRPALAVGLRCLSATIPSSAAPAELHFHAIDPPPPGCMMTAANSSHNGPAESPAAKPHHHHHLADFHPFRSKKEHLGHHHHHQQQKQQHPEGDDDDAHGDQHAYISQNTPTTSRPATTEPATIRSGAGQTHPAQGNFSMQAEGDDREQGGWASSEDQAQAKRSLEADEARMNPHKDRGGQAAKAFQGRSTEWRTVQDPITRAPLRQRDVTEQEYRRGLYESASVREGLLVPQPAADDSDQSKQQHSATPKHPSEISPQPSDRPAHEKGSTALIYQLPITSPAEDVVARIFRSMFRVEALLFAGWSVLSLALNPRLSTAVTLGLGGVFGGWLRHLVFRRVIDGLRDQELERERRRGQAVDAARLPESAEWLNSFLKVLWPQIDAKMFDSVADMLEDVLQASLPSFINSVKVSEITQGTTSLRLLAVRRLPDGRRSGSDRPSKERKREAKESSEAAQQLGLVNESEREIGRAIQANQRKRGEPLALDEEADDGAEYINLEIAFAYRPPASSDAQERIPIHKRTSAHMLLSFFVKTGFANAPIPVDVSVRGCVGTLRIRIQLTSEPPFLGNTTLSFVGLPRVEIDAAPLRMVSIMDVPFISKFVQNAIDAAMATYTAPGCLELDLGQLISGDDIQREITALGAIVIYIESADDVEESDSFGGSDPYAVVSFSRYGKALYSTRVVLEDRNPRWHESTAILLHPEVVKAGERVALELRDSDRTSSDDLLGRAEMPLFELLQNQGQLVQRADGLTGSMPGSKRGGRITWKAGYFPKVPVNTKLARFEKVLDVKPCGYSAGEGKDEKVVPKPTDEELLRRAEKSGKVPVEYTPPDPSLPSGVLSIKIHQIAALDVPRNPDRERRRRKPFEPGQEVSEPIGDASPDAPSSYVEILICDSLVYRTRTKMQSRAPIFQAGTERFIRNWQTATVMLTVREARINEQDPIIGIVSLRLESLFRDKSQATDWYPISGGVGSGRIRVSLLFRSVDCRLERPLRGFDVGTLLVCDAITLLADDDRTRTDLGGCYIKLRTIAGKATVSSVAHGRNVQQKSKGESVSWTLSEARNPIRLPVYRRHASAVLIEWRAKNPLRKTTVWSIAALWLSEVADSGDGNDVGTFRVPVWDAKDDKALSRLRQNFQSYTDATQGQALGGKQIGTVELKLTFRAGISRAHRKFVASRPEQRAAMEAWQASAASAGTDAMLQEELGREEEGSSSSSDSSSDSDDGGGGDESGGKMGMVKRMKRDRKEREEWSQAKDGGGFRVKPVRMAEQLKEKAMDTVEKVKSEFDTSKSKVGGQVETEV